MQDHHLWRMLRLPFLPWERGIRVSYPAADVGMKKAAAADAGG